MPQPSPLETLIDLARDATDQAARTLGRCHSQRDDARRQLSMLHDYRQDYLEKLQTAMQTGLAATDCHNYRRFIATLDAAIVQQAQVLADAEQQLTTGRALWQQARGKLTAFEALQTRAQRARAQVYARREQRAQDEYAARRYYDDQAVAV